MPEQKLTAAEQILTTLIQKSLNGLDTATTFLAAEIPDVIHQLLLWNAVKYGVYMALAIFIPFIYTTTVYKAMKHEVDEGVLVLFIIIGGVTTLASSISLCNLQWLQIWIAPKVWLIEYAAKLVK